MKEDFVSFEIAKKLKEKGFDEPCNMYYHIHNDIVDCVGSLEYTCDCNYDFINSKNKYRCSAPTISQVLKWLREEKKIHVATGVTPKSLWRYVIMFCDNRGLKEPTITVMNYSSYSSAISAGIEYVIDNLI